MRKYREVFEALGGVVPLALVLLTCKELWVNLGSARNVALILLLPGMLLAFRFIPRQVLGSIGRVALSLGALVVMYFCALPSSFLGLLAFSVLLVGIGYTADAVHRALKTVETPGEVLRSPN